MGGTLAPLLLLPLPVIFCINLCLRHYFAFHRGIHPPSCCKQIIFLISDIVFTSEFHF